MSASPRPKQRLRPFTLAALLSLLLCLATAGLWVRSQWTDDTLEWAPASSTRAYAVRSLSGFVSFDKAERRAPETSPGLHWHSDPLDALGRMLTAEVAGPRLEDLGVRTYTREDDQDVAESGGSIGYRSVAVSYWLILIATAILPVTAAYRRLRPAKGPAARRPARGEPPRTKRS